MINFLLHCKRNNCPPSKKEKMLGLTIAVSASVLYLPIAYFMLIASIMIGGFTETTNVLINILLFCCEYFAFLSVTPIIAALGLFIASAHKFDRWQDNLKLYFIFLLPCVAIGVLLFAIPLLFAFLGDI